MNLLKFRYNRWKKLKIEMGNNMSDISSLTVDGEGGIKVKNGEFMHGFVEFYENMIMEKIKLSSKGRTYRRYHTYIPNKSGNLKSWRYRTVSSDILSTSGVTAGDYGQSQQFQ